jgi:hypothetical protein
MKHFSQQETIQKIDSYLKSDLCRSKTPIKNPNKVFYHYSEWSGWRFYKKAVMNRDWKSIVGHIKDKFN